MNPSKFDTIVKNRANQRVQDKIEKFRKEVGEAFKRLHRSLAPNFYHGFNSDRKIPDDVERVLKNVFDGMYFIRQKEPASPENPLKACEWPLMLWIDEEKEVAGELLAAMDEMQKALCAPPVIKGETTAQPAME